MTKTFKSFAALAAEINKQDTRKAGQLRKSAPLGKHKPGTGPRVAR